MPSPKDLKDSVGQPLFPNNNGTPWPKRTGTLPSVPVVRPDQTFNLSSTSARMPIVIPAAAKKRVRPLEPVPVAQARSRGHMAWPIVIIAGALIAVLTLAFAIPLGNSQQQPVTLAQGIGNLITTGQFGNVNVAQNSGQPSRSIELSCGGIDIWGTCANALLDNGTVGSGVFQPPVAGAVITQYFGNPEYQSWCGCVKPHTGIDLAAPYGTPLTASDAGEVIWVGWDWSGLGHAVKISHGNYLATIYGHMDSYIVKVGQYVTKGQIIGYEGSSGASTGPHVHFMVLLHNVWVDPQTYMQLP